MDKEEVLRNAHELIEYSEGMKIDEVRESPHRAAPSTVGRDFFYKFGSAGFIFHGYEIQDVVRRKVGT